MEVSVKGPFRFLSFLLLWFLIRIRILDKEMTVRRILFLIELQ